MDYGGRDTVLQDAYDIGSLIISMETVKQRASSSQSFRTSLVFLGSANQLFPQSYDSCLHSLRNVLKISVPPQ